MLVRHVGRGVGADLVGLSGLVWIAIEPAGSAAELVRELGVAEPAIDETIDALVQAGWMERVCG